MARRAKSSLSPVHIVIIVAAVAVFIWGGYTLMHRTSGASFNGTSQLSVREYLENSNALSGNTYQIEGTIDSLSALVRLSLAAAATGRCDLAGSVFDGRRRLEWSSRTLGVGPAPMAGVSGEALRCALRSRLVAGFRRGDDPAEVGQPRDAEAWIAVLGPGVPPMPVRVEFPSTFLGAMRLDLVRFGPTAP